MTDNDQSSQTTTYLLSNYPMLLRFDQVTEVTGIQTKTLYNWQYNGKLPFLAKKIGGQWKVHTQELAIFLDSFKKQKIKRKAGRPSKAEQFEIKGGNQK